MNPINFFRNILFEMTSAETAEQTSAADVTITHNNGDKPPCSISKNQLAGIKKRVEERLKNGIENGFGYFPINKKNLQLKIKRFVLNPNLICKTLTADAGITVDNHNKFRNEYKKSGLSVEEALKRGLVTKPIDLEFSCPKPEDPNYNWAESPVYNGVTKCEDIINEVADDDLPATMFATPLQEDEAQKYIDDQSTATLITPYAKGGKPVECSSGKNYVDSFHKILIANWLPPQFKYLRYVLRTMSGDGWSAWQLRKSCKGVDGKTYTANDLMFDFGARIWAPLNVEIDGQMKTRTLIIGAFAAAGTSSFAKGVVAYFAPDAPLERVIGAEFTKKVYLEAKFNNWPIIEEED